MTGPPVGSREAPGTCSGECPDVADAWASAVGQARLAIELLAARGHTLAVAESLTGGLVTGAVTSVAGSSVVLRGGIVSYATDLKAALLDVPAALLANKGAVDAAVAQAMARGVAQRLGASYGLATTGVAGPGPAEGKPAGTVFVAVGGPAVPAGWTSHVRGLQLAGDRRQIRVETVRSVLSLLVSALREANG